VNDVTFACNVVTEKQSWNAAQSIIKLKAGVYTVKLCGICVLFFFNDCTEHWNIHYRLFL